MKKVMVGVFTIFLLANFLVGCSSKQEQEDVQNQEEPIYEWGTVTGKTITIWGDKDDLKRPYMVRAFDDYEKTTGNIIKTVALSKKDLDEKVPAAFSSDTEEKPDILLSYGGNNVENLRPLENFYDFTNAPWLNDLTDTALNQTIFDGKVIGFPHGESSISGTLYNKELFNKYNIEIPKNQKEFLEVCETLLKAGITPMYLPYAEITMLLYQFPMDSFLKDQTVLDGLNTGSLSYRDIPEMKEIVTWYKTMADRGYFGEDYLNNDWAGMDDAMKGGKYGMMLCWDTWLYTDFTGDPSNIGIMPAFMGHPDEGCFEGANIILNLVNKHSEQLDASLDFINFMADPCNYNKHYQDVYTAPVFNNQSGSITTPQYMEAEALINKHYYNSIAWSRVRGFSQIDATYIQQYMQEEITLDECLENMNSARLKRIGL